MKRGHSQTTFTRLGPFCQRSYHRKCKRRGVGGQKSQNPVKVVCERPLIYNDHMYLFSGFVKMTLTWTTIHGLQILYVSY